MSFVPFVLRFPEVGEAETRVLTVYEHDSLPPDRYSLVEFYCDEEGCDCRKVFLNVLSTKRRQVLATISFGWENAAFYRRRLPSLTDEQIRGIRGPALERYQPQTRYAKALLDLVVKMAFDEAYVERLKRHYRMFHDAVDKECASHHSTRRAACVSDVSRNAPCSCGSGRKYKRCCGR